MKDQDKTKPTQTANDPKAAEQQLVADSTNPTELTKLRQRITELEALKVEW